MINESGFCTINVSKNGNYFVLALPDGTILPRQTHLVLVSGLEKPNAFADSPNEVEVRFLMSESEYRVIDTKLYYKDQIIPHSVPHTVKMERVDKDGLVFVSFRVYISARNSLGESACVVDVSASSVLAPPYPTVGSPSGEMRY